MKRNNEHNEFVGNFDNFFDNESSLTGGLDFDSPISDPVVIPTPPRNPRNIAVSAAGPKIQSSLSPAVAFVLENTPKYRCKVTYPYYIRDDINGTILDHTKCRPVSVGVSAGPQTPPSSGSGSGSGSGGTTTTSGSGGTSVGGDGTISETVSTGSNQSETTTEQKPSSGEVKKTESDCKIDYMKFLAFMFMGFILFYFLAKHYKKDKIYMSITGVIIGTIGYYLFYKNKCK